MRTPAGKECRYFYGDYHRGRQREECRLLENSSPPQHWTRDLCGRCPVPGILQANACENLVLEGKVTRPFPYIFRQVNVSAYCIKTSQAVAQPHIGCGQCHPLPFILPGDILDSDPSA